MDKKNVISLVLGLIIGALAIWLVMSFTSAGSTMVLRPGAINSTTPTPTTTLSQAFDFTMKDVNTASFKTKDGKDLHYTADLKGKFYTDASGKKAAEVTDATITKISPALADVLKSTVTKKNPGTISVDDAALKSVLSNSTDRQNLDKFSTTNTGTAADLAMETAAFQAMYNLDGTSPEALANRKASFSATDSVTARFKSEFGADSWKLADVGNIHFNTELEKEFQGTGITEAFKWWGFKKIWQSIWNCFWHGNCDWPST